jgi:hypothetical protein
VRAHYGCGAVFGKLAVVRRHLHGHFKRQPCTPSDRKVFARHFGPFKGNTAKSLFFPALIGNVISAG